VRSEWRILRCPGLISIKGSNALHLLDDAGGLAADLERILRRIPDGWGRWIGCREGWYPLIVELDRRLADLDPGYHVHQVKEKYGTLSYYIQGAPIVAAAMEALVDQAEAESAHICESCGALACSWRTVAGMRPAAVRAPKGPATGRWRAMTGPSCLPGRAQPLPPRRVERT
jgi:hypothetical protein